MDFNLVFSNLLGLFLLIGVGYLAVRLGVVPASSSKSLTALLMNITTPATVFVSLIRPFEASFLTDGVTIILLAALLFLLFALTAWLAARLLGVREGRRGIWMFACIFCNNGFMGFPIALALFQEEGLTLAVILGIPFNLLVYTLGAKLVCMDRIQDARNAPISWRSVLLNNVNIAMVLGLVFYIGRILVPTALMTPLTYLSNVTTPLSMLITGITLANGSFAALFKDRDVITASLMRLLVFPLLTWAIMLPLPIANPLVCAVTLVIMAMPAPALATILAEHYGGNAKLGSQIVFLSSLLCMVTIPLITMLL